MRVEFQVMRRSILEVPMLEEYAVPIPEPYDELFASTNELQIARLPIREMLPVPADPVPIPDP
jgi:hypothetical protein